MTTYRLQLQIVRVVRLARLLEGNSRRFSYRDLADRFEVTTRTIRRDIVALRDAGAELRCDRDPMTGHVSAVHSLVWLDEGRRRQERAL